ncbi:serine/threonine-protein kinase [Streptomyces sp. V1I1]|uniref:serine/threonine-protein kinase n=1 Tax=Streptomyces sp. V1I1 TaxID=3042272 RepID=UPI00277E62A8|nr:serine/threonine-protein kinase [Streptomyces sp. V1I1]MDQ0945972.1 serine/threonine protein kinase [Streptomyces sp. V1I1]
MLVADRYRLESPIGRGGMGEVWRATDEVLGRPVAVKLLLGDEPDSEAAARFRLEGQTAARLNHPHVVGVFDFGAWDGRFYLVMELVEGRSLAQELAAEGALPSGRVALVAAQTAAGLASAHRQGIVHRDIKPGNLMSDADGTVKLGDFGIARFVDDPAAALTTAGQILGTSLYLAPERALGQPAGPASDMYSLGCVLYQLLTGCPPFQADTATATLYQHIDAAPVPPLQRGADLPPAFENYLLGLLAKQPEDRPTAQQVANWFGSGAWQGAREPLPAPETPPPAQVLGAGPAHASETGLATTYMLPPTDAQPGQGRRSVPTQRHGAREFVRRRPRVASAVAGAAAFLIAVLIGVAWFSPDKSSANTPRGETSAPAHPDLVPTPTPDPAMAPTVSPAPDDASVSRPSENEEEDDQEKKHKGEDAEGRHGEED